jgi:glycosyltransferase involved in cell wall biosynthesis
MGIDMPLVAIGKVTEYGKQVLKYVHSHHMNNIYFIESVRNTDLPPIYQMAQLFVYPSVFEGFGIPILEALYSKTPVITSKGGCFAETGGPNSYYVDPFDDEELGNAIKEILEDTSLSKKMKENGYLFAQGFNPDKVANRLMRVYKETMQ